MSMISDQPPRGWRLWVMAARPRTLPLSVGPVVVGVAYAAAWGLDIRWLPLVATIMAAMVIQIGTNLWNDLGDALQGADLPHRHGPPRVTALGWATPGQVQAAALAAFAVAGLLGLYLVQVGGWPILLLGLLSLLSGWAYSHGPRPISYTPFSEIFVMVFFGLAAVMGTAWLQGLGLDWRGLVLGLIMGFPACAVLMVNNYRDMEADQLAGRRTLAICAGAEHAKVIYGAFVLAPLVLIVSPLAPSGAWLGLLLSPMAIRLLVDFSATSCGPAFNPILARTAKYQLFLAVAMALGMVLV